MSGLRQAVLTHRLSLLVPLRRAAPCDIRDFLESTVVAEERASGEPLAMKGR